MSTNTEKLLASLATDLRDAARIQRDGQEDDLRAAVQMLTTQCNTLSHHLRGTLATLNAQSTDLEVAKSNLALIQANNEMLEDALKSAGPAATDVGWGRAGKNGHVGSRDSLQLGRFSLDSSPSPGAQPATADSRFFRFSRFGKDKESRPSTPVQPLPSAPLPRRSGSSDRSSSRGSSSSHAEHVKELEELRAKHKDDLVVLQTQLDAERRKTKEALEEKKLLEGEIEGLSEALFEEANKMVSTERKLRAASDDARKVAESERDALRETLKLIQGKLPEPASRTSLTSESGSVPVTPVTPDTKRSSVIPKRKDTPVVPGAYAFGEDESSRWA